MVNVKKLLNISYKYVLLDVYLNVILLNSLRHNYGYITQASVKFLFLQFYLHGHGFFTAVEV